MIARTEHRKRLLAFLETISQPGRFWEGIADEDPLVASGLIDSLALVEVIVYLESEVGVDFSLTGIQPDNLRSVGAILDTIEQHAR